jgi:hypothetical protein
MKSKVPTKVKQLYRVVRLYLEDPDMRLIRCPTNSDCNVLNLTVRIKPNSAIDRHLQQAIH